MRPLAPALAVVVLAALLTAGCGSGSGLPEDPPCPDPDPRLLGTSALPDYQAAVNDALDRFQAIDQEFRSAWPERRLRTRRSFREDFVAFVAGTTCLADTLSAAPVPPELSAFGDEFRSFLAELRASLERGRDAVRTRNSSEYERWINEVDGLAIRYTEFQDRLMAGH